MVQTRFKLVLFGSTATNFLQWRYIRPSPHLMPLVSIWLDLGFFEGLPGFTFMPAHSLEIFGANFEDVPGKN